MRNIGITGHQHLEKRLKNGWLKKRLFEELSAITGKICAYSSLAIGADQLFAEVALKSSRDLVAIIPCENYLNTFSSRAQKNYQHILDHCNNVETLDHPAPSQEAFLHAGKTIVDRSDILFAVWDGKPAKGKGGTADIVEYALGQGKKIVHFDTDALTVRILSH